METLAPSILEIRNSFLEKFKNEKLDAISKKLTELFDVEKDPVKNQNEGLKASVGVTIYFQDR